MKNKHLTLQDRQSIEQMLNAKKTFAEIARTLEKDKCTISKEVRAHVEFIRIGAKGVAYNNCKNRYGCKKTNVCTKCNSPQHFRLWGGSDRVRNRFINAEESFSRFGII